MHCRCGIFTWFVFCLEGGRIEYCQISLMLEKMLVIVLKCLKQVLNCLSLKRLKSFALKHWCNLNIYNV